MRDYSNQATKHRRRGKKSPSVAVGISLSIILTGTAAAALTWLNHTALVKKDSLVVEQPKVKVAIDAPLAEDKAVLISHEILEATENFYTFYDLLVTGEVPIDVKDGKTLDDAISQQLKSTFIQAASFRTHEAAERTRVALLFLDLKARVVPPSSNTGEWYRIVLGPFKTKRDMSAAADVLAKNGFDAQVRKE